MPSTRAAARNVFDSTTCVKTRTELRSARRLSNELDRVAKIYRIVQGASEAYLSGITATIRAVPKESQ